MVEKVAPGWVAHCAFEQGGRGVGGSRSCLGGARAGYDSSASSSRLQLPLLTSLAHSLPLSSARIPCPLPIPIPALFSQQPQPLSLPLLQPLPAGPSA